MAQRLQQTKARESECSPDSIGPLAERCPSPDHTIRGVLCSTVPWHGRAGARPAPLAARSLASERSHERAVAATATALARLPLFWRRARTRRPGARHVLVRLLPRRVGCGGVLRLLVLRRTLPLVRLPLPRLPLPPALLRRLRLLLLQRERERVVVREPGGRGAACAGDRRRRGPRRREEALGLG